MYVKETVREGVWATVADWIVVPCIINLRVPNRAEGFTTNWEISVNI
jgi:hypothetical protein